MLSVLHHALYWALSIISLQAQSLRPMIKECLSTDDDALALFEHAVVLYAIWFGLFLIDLGTPAPHRRNRQNRRRANGNSFSRTCNAMGAEIVRRRDWIFEFATAIMCLIVGDVALWTTGDTEERFMGKAERVLATFMFLGVVEPIWHNASFSSS
ncbi:hypothetical protein V8C42DRAFT_322139 [Trichoderma barbatum]